MLRMSIKSRNVLGQIPRALRSEAARITEEALRHGESVAKVESPVRTGFLRSSVGVRMTSQTGGELVARASYAGFVNYGTRRMRARPFMDKGAEAAKDYLLREWRQVERRLPRV